MQLSDGDLDDHEGRLGQAETRTVRLGADIACIPDLGFIEQQLLMAAANLEA